MLNLGYEKGMLNNGKRGTFLSGKYYKTLKWAPLGAPFSAVIL